MESPDVIVTRVKEALRYLPPERIFLNPDCGFGTFANRPLNSADAAASKLSNMVRAAETLRKGIWMS